MSDARCYTIPQLLEKLNLKRATFFHLRKDGRLPFLEEIRPRLGRYPRYRADLVDRYLANEYRLPIPPKAARASFHKLQPVVRRGRA
jgi:predicted DNA-binding transcriptional regulator AlpA